MVRFYRSAEVLRHPKAGGREREIGVNGGGQERPPHMFLLDLALRYFVSFLYNLNGFMEPLRTGIVRGGFLCLG